MNYYRILAFYQYVKIENPQKEVEKHHKFLSRLDVRARVYIAENGINAQMSFVEKDMQEYIDWLTSDERFEDVHFKIDSYHEHVFPRIAIKPRKQLVALDYDPNLSDRGKHLSPEEWKKMFENRDKDTLVLDVRNDYESKIGHFEGAECPNLKQFREFPKYVEKLKKQRDPKKTKVMMYCTGGIRCEVYSALLKEKGFDNVYQLHGGIIQYGREIGNQHWLGKLFVFDDRLSIAISEDRHELISHCHFCETPSDTYYNCANMDCNELFLCCLKCAEKQQGCCSEECLSGRRRPFEKVDKPKPFRKWYHYTKTKEKVIGLMDE